MGSNWTMSYLREIWHKHRPFYFYLQQNKMQCLCKVFNLFLAMIVGPNGRIGGRGRGVAFFYNNEFQVKIFYTSN